MNINTKDENKLPNFQKEFWINDDPFGKLNQNINKKKLFMRRVSSIKKEGSFLKPIKIKPSPEFSTNKFITPINGFNKYDHSAEDLNFDMSNSYFYWNLNSRSTSNVLDGYISRSNLEKKSKKSIINFAETIEGIQINNIKKLSDELLFAIENYRRLNKQENLRTNKKPILNEKPTQDEINLLNFIKNFSGYLDLMFKLTPGSPFESRWYFKELKGNGVWLSQYEYGNYHIAIHSINGEIRMGVYKANLQWGKCFIFDFYEEDVNSNIFLKFEGIIIDSKKEGECYYYKKKGISFQGQEIIEFNFNAENEKDLGKFKMPDGSIWIGPVKDSVIKNGSGMIKTIDGKTWKCNYENDFSVK